MTARNIGVKIESGDEGQTIDGIWAKEIKIQKYKENFMVVVFLYQGDPICYQVKGRKLLLLEGETPEEYDDF